MNASQHTMFKNGRSIQNVNNVQKYKIQNVASTKRYVDDTERKKVCLSLYKFVMK